MKKVFIMTALVVGMIAGSSFGAVDWGYCRPPSSKKPVTPTVDRNLDKEIELERLRLANTLLGGGRTVSANPITEKDLPDEWADFRPEHVKFVREKAEQREALYQLKLGALYLKGAGGVSQIYSEAARWLTRSAAQGNAIAQKTLASLKKNGHIPS